MGMREKLIDIVETYADFLDWDTKEDVVDSIMDLLATDNNVGHKWIPVTERLPEKNTSVLVYYKHGRNIFWYDGKDGFCDIDEYGMNVPDNTVTHWMPLPEPPKGE